MAKKNIATKIPKKAKKIWCPIVAPKMFQSKVLGKSHVYSPEQLIEKPITVNLMNLTGDIKAQNTQIGFRVATAKNGQGLTTIWSYKILPAHVKRLVRRKRDKIDDSFNLKTKDNIKIKIKPLILTLNKTSKAVRRDIRKAAQNSLAKTFAKAELEDTVKMMIMRKLQNTLKRELNKITPIRTCEIRSLARLTEKQKEKAKIITPPKEPKKAKPKSETKEAPKKEE
jgi:ribosomal protein S3AE